MSAKAMAPIRILIADRHRLVRVGIRVMLSETRSCQHFELDEAETTEEAIAKVETGNYQVVVMEYHLPGRGGPTATKLMLARKPGICVLGLSYHVERAYVEQMLAAGAKGYILHNIEGETLGSAIKTVVGGKSFFSNEVALLMMRCKMTSRPVDPLERLSKREKEIFGLILEGLRDREIGERLSISKRTVDTHRHNLMRKLGARNSMELAQVARRSGMMS